MIESSKRELSMQAGGDKTRNTPRSCMGEDGGHLNFLNIACQLSDYLFQKSGRSPRCGADFSHNVILRSTFITTTVNVKIAGATKCGFVL